MGSILPLGRILRGPSTPPAPRLPAPNLPPAPAPVQPNLPPADNNSPPAPDDQALRENALRSRNLGLSGLVNTSLRGLLNFSKRVLPRRTLLGE